MPRWYTSALGEVQSASEYANSVLHKVQSRTRAAYDVVRTNTEAESRLAFDNIQHLLENTETDLGDLSFIQEIRAAGLGGVEAGATGAAGLVIAPELLAALAAAGLFYGSYKGIEWLRAHNHSIGASPQKYNPAVQPREPGPVKAGPIPVAPLKPGNTFVNPRKR